MKVGIEFHNLSTRADASVRTGIQQVVAHILLAQSRLRDELAGQGIELVPLPMLPPAYRFPTLSHANNSELVLRDFSQESGLTPEELWGGGIQADFVNWSDEEFYERCVGLDWLFITSLFDFDHVATRLKARLPNLKIAVLVYDLGPIRRPEFVAFGMQGYFENRYIPSIRSHADIVFTISRHTGLDCIEYFMDRPEFKAELYSTPLPAEIPALRSVSQSQMDNFLDRLGVQAGRYFVAIGTIEPRKNLGSAILGFRRFCDLDPEATADMRFVLIGHPGWNNENNRLFGLLGDRAHQVIFPGYLSREEVEMAMLGSAGLVMPSRLEGFGMPLALANQLTAPTITCNNSSLPETTRVSSIFVPTDGCDAMALAFWRLAARGKRPIPTDAELADVRRTLSNYWDQLLRDWLDCIRGAHGFAA